MLLKCKNKGVKPIINLYNSTETNFTSNGIVVLSDCISALVTEEDNGQFELALEYPLDERGKWKYLIEDNIIKADGQPFRIYYKFKTLTSIKCNARHIFYDLLDNFLEDVRPTSTSGYGALDYILTRTQYVHPFTSVGDVGGSNTKYFVRVNVVDAIMGSDGIIANWGGELVRDNFVIKLLGARGLDRGVLVSYGKNIQGIEETLDMDGLCTRLMPLGKDALMLPEKYVDSQYINNFPHPKIAVKEFSDIGVDDTNGITEAMAIVSLRAAAAAYILSSKCDIPQFNYKIDFLELSKTEEYKNYAVLETVYMGDTVTIKHSKLNINLKAKVIKTIKNCITGRIENIELGSFKPNLATSLNNSIQEIKNEITQVTSDYQNAVDNATALITGAKGGNVVIRQNSSGQPYEILIMDTTDVNTAVNVWRWNMGGFGYSSTGINGPYGTAITMDGHIVGTFITALIISANQIVAGIITGTNVEFDLDAGFLQVNHSDGSYSKMSSAGFMRHIGTTNKDYHYLMATGTGQTPDPGFTVSVSLPAEFNDMDVSFSVNPKNIFNVASDCVMKNLCCQATYNATTNALDIEAYCDVQRIGNLAIIRIAIEFAYTAIA